MRVRYTLHLISTVLSGPTAMRGQVMSNTCCWRPDWDICVETTLATSCISEDCEDCLDHEVFTAQSLWSKEWCDPDTFYIFGRKGIALPYVLTLSNSCIDDCPGQAAFSCRVIMQRTTCIHTRMVVIIACNTRIFHAGCVRFSRPFAMIWCCGMFLHNITYAVLCMACLYVKKI